MHVYHYFRSTRRPDLHAFTDDSSGAKLPREDGPWRLVRAVDPGEGWTGIVDRSAVEAGVTMNGYYLVDSDTELTFDQTPTRSRDFQ
jgi:hypothetical protein